MPDRITRMAHDAAGVPEKTARMVDFDSSPSSTAVPASRPGPVGTSARGRSDAAERRRFEVVLRGYERTAVDEVMSRIADETAAMRHDLAESERRRALAEDHASATESEIRTLRSEQQHRPRTPPEESFGFRAEKLLRLAEQEAADVRATAAREASALMEQTRAEAEQHRHEVEQSLITRSSLLDQQAGQRTAELQEREQQIAAQVSTAKAEVDGMHESSQRAAERYRKQAEADAEAVRARAAHDARRLREQAEQEVKRLGALRDATRSELARLAEVLKDGLRAAGTGPERGAGARRVGPATAAVPPPRGPVRGTEPPATADSAEPTGMAPAASAPGR